MNITKIEKFKCINRNTIVKLNVSVHLHKYEDGQKIYGYIIEDYTNKNDIVEVTNAGSLYICVNIIIEDIKQSLIDLLQKIDNT